MSTDNSIPDEWYFITPPQSVKWEKSSKSTIIDTYGTNNPYLNYGSTSLRKLTLGDAMLEGFSDGKEVESNVTNLEACMQMVIDEGTGFTSPYCWNVFAGDKSYGTYIIDSVSVEEQMRDMTGKATRATVSVTFQEVSSYQVTSGTDITSTAVVGGAQQGYIDALESKGAEQDAKVAKAKGAGAKNSTGQAAGGGGGGGGGAAADKKAPAGPKRNVFSPSGNDGAGNVATRYNNG